MFNLFGKASKEAKSKKNREFRSLLCETLDKRELCAVDTAASLDVVRSNSRVRDAEAAVIRTGRAMTVQVSGNLDTQRQDHSFLRKTSMPGSYSGSVSISLDKGNLVERFNIRQNYNARTKIDDIDLATIAADVSISGSYRLGLNRNAITRVVASDWRSSGTANVKVESGPTRGVDYSLTLLAQDGRESGNKLSGLTRAELVGASVRNALPVNSKAADWLGNRMTQLEKMKIPGVDVAKAIGDYPILVDLFSSSKAKTDDQILADALRSESWMVGAGSDSELLRYAEGGVTSIVGAKFNISKGFSTVLAKVPIATGAFFGGLVTGSVGTEVNLGVSVTLAGVFAADSRGYGFLEGTSASVKLRLEALLTGNVAVIGIERWSLVSADVKAGAFAQGTLRIVVGSLNAKPDALRNGAILYVTSNSVQRGSFNSYLSAEVSADVGAVLKTKVTILGVTVWKDKKEKSWNVYSREIVSPQRSLRE
jgi:hypothetical protein